MEKNYVSTRVEVVDATKAKGQINHDTRSRKPSYVEYPDATIVTWAKQDDTWARFGAKNTDATMVLKTLMDKNLTWQNDLYFVTHKRKRPSNAKPFLRGIITFTDPSFASPDELRAKAEEYIWKLARKYHTVPVYLVEHRDEKVPHFHFIMPNIDEHGKSVKGQIDPQACKDMQDMVAETFASLGFVRGESVEMPRKHYTVREAHRREIREVEAAQAEKDGIVRDFEILRDRVSELRADIERLAAEKAEAEAELKKRGEERKKLVQETQRLIADAEERKATYRAFDTVTKKLREEVKERKEALASMERELMQGEAAVRRTRDGLETLRSQEPNWEREEAIRAVICGLAERANLPTKIKERILGEVEAQWPSSIGVGTWRGMAAEVAQGLEWESSRVR